MRRERWIVITSINQPTRALKVISDLCREGWAAVVVGDTKTPADWSCEGVEFLSVARQREMFGDLADLIPYRHYCRKNLGYLYAIRAGAELIFDTDDDNIPYENFGRVVAREVNGRLLRGPGWVNVYRHFIDGVKIWPRGLPLDAIESGGILSPQTAPRACPIQQYLADSDPDVDAIFRLTTPGEYFFRRDELPVMAERDCWVPFNSQNTFFFAEAFPLLYLPCHVSFRMTDIWRSFVAQAALWHKNLHVSFHAPTVKQLRNQHDLMVDFADEIPGYLHNRKIAAALTETLTTITLESSTSAVALKLWESLGSIEIIPPQEMAIIRRWLSECAAASSTPAATP